MKVLVIGDVMIDINCMSESERSSPENSNIQIQKIIDTKYILGGAGNVAKNLKNLKIDVEFVSVVGNDTYGKKLKKMLDLEKIKNKIIFDENRATTQKYRIFNKGTNVSRHDIENNEPIDKTYEKKILEYLNKKIMDFDAIIISDYDKGVVTKKLCEFIIKTANNHDIPTFVDPKTKCLEKYKNCFCFKPNINETILLTNETDLDKMFFSIKTTINPENIVITNGEKGICFNSSSIWFKHENVDVVDVTGAGDVALCVLVYVWLNEKDMMLACEMSDFICRKSVKTLGNYCISLDDINGFYLKNKVCHYENENVFKMIEKLKKNNKIVFTNGCFDIMHSAHLKLLQFCKRKGDVLIVGLNSDISVKKIKGPSRPVNNLNERIEMLKCLDFVDFILVFDDETPCEILKKMRPNILIKGGDYSINDIIGKEFADETLIFNYIEEKSTTNVIQQMKQSLLH